MLIQFLKENKTYYLIPGKDLPAAFAYGPHVAAAYLILALI